MYQRKMGFESTLMGWRFEPTETKPTQLEIYPGRNWNWGNKYEVLTNTYCDLTNITTQVKQDIKQQNWRFYHQTSGLIWPIQKRSWALKNQEFPNQMWGGVLNQVARENRQG